jgi:hypothetical protein
MKTRKDGNFPKEGQLTLSLRFIKTYQKNNKFVQNV